MCSPRNTFRVVMFGLENAGKTTIVDHCCKCSTKKSVRIWPNIQHFAWGPLRVTSINVGPRQPKKKNVFNGAKAIIFVIDSSDYNAFDDAKNQFWCVVNESRLRRATVLVMANKSDCAGALLPKQVEEKMGLSCLCGKWNVVQTNAKTGDGVCEGLSWIKAYVSPRKRCWIALLLEFIVRADPSSHDKRDC